jgi:raffinose/stachyose/melibiose transport system substrate-binding protein
MSKRIWIFMGLLVVASLLFVACGGGAPAEEAAEEPAAEVEEAVEEVEEAAEEGEPVTLRVLIHQNPPMVEFMEAFNDEFEAAYPNVTVDLSIVEAGGPADGPDRSAVCGQLR